jgi:hypothetical protein
MERLPGQNSKGGCGANGNPWSKVEAGTDTLSTDSYEDAAKLLKGRQ